MEYANQGNKARAIASFVSDVNKHDGTRQIGATPMLTLLLSAEYDNGLQAFERYLRGFSV